MNNTKGENMIDKDDLKTLAISQGLKTVKKINIKVIVGIIVTIITLITGIITTLFAAHVLIDDEK